MIQVSAAEAEELAKVDRDKLSKYEVDAGEKYKTGKSKRLYPRKCYTKAFEYVEDKSDLEDIRLVHGLYLSYGINNHCGHGWVELPNDIVFDGVLQRFYEKEGYYQYYEIIKQVEYQPSEIHQIGFKNGGTYGPWH
ncbi:hypothetical protein AKG34_21425 [Peribacillus butanolivorans]|uniref:hypothetical protein n=1 Tax=Peribacillus butanolivorans TaxID=421767 RepID=UPI0006A6CB57|nr:hypothetical protein [Peribacillus butanolivorans]KON67382.1 hypothetical protein AKG34_21425 [Peribacillus butanolivorans]